MIPLPRLCSLCYWYSTVAFFPLPCGVSTYAVVIHMLQYVVTVVKSIEVRRLG